MRVHIRWMIRRDMEEVLAIEAESFEIPWNEDEFIRCLRNRNVICMVAEANELVIGYMIYELHKHALTILNFAVDPKTRRRAVGRQMVEKLTGKLSPMRRNKISLVTRESNVAAQMFFHACGFRAIDVLRNHYEASDEDGYLFAYHLFQPSAVSEVAPLWP